MGLASTGRRAVGLCREGGLLALVASYVLDWVLVVVLGGVSFAIGNTSPNKRPFSVDDRSISSVLPPPQQFFFAQLTRTAPFPYSFPYAQHEACPVWLLVLLAVILPAIVIVLVALTLIPGPTTAVPRDSTTTTSIRGLVWRRRLWELHAGVLGLALALASAWFLVNFLKNLLGKPRPDLLARCAPNPSLGSRFRVGGWPGEAGSAGLFSSGVCTATDSKRLDDGFRSYPSGHAAIAAAGLVYLSLFLAGKLGVVIPSVLLSKTASLSPASSLSAFPSRMPTEHESSEASQANRRAPPARNRSASSRSSEHSRSLRRQAAAPPVYLLVLALVPFYVSVWIAASRWYNFRHHGFDILSGYLVGLAAAVFSFRYYHLPVGGGAGWAWGPRSRDRAFWAGVGRPGYAEENGGGAGNAPRDGVGASGASSAVADDAATRRNGHGTAGHPSSPEVQLQQGSQQV